MSRSSRQSPIVYVFAHRASAVIGAVSCKLVSPLYACAARVDNLRYVLYIVELEAADGLMWLNWRRPTALPLLKGPAERSTLAGLLPLYTPHQQLPLIPPLNVVETINVPSASLSDGVWHPNPDHRKPYKGGAPTSLMVWISGVSDEKNSILLSEGTLPNIRVRLSACFRGPPSSSMEIPPIDALAAWFLTMHTAQYAERKGYDNVMRRALETWILGPPLRHNAVLAAMFAGQSENHRVILHRQPSMRGAKRMWENVWAGAHYSLPVRHRRDRYRELKTIGQPFMQDVLSAYANGHAAVASVMERSGHASFFARAEEA